MAIDYEANRQVDLIEEGKTIDQETRLFDTKKNETRSMRSKEDAHDYRYFPDPDLLPLEVTDEFIEQLKADIPELPDDKKKRFIDEFKVSAYEATILVSDIDTAKYFEEVVTKMGKNRDMKLAVNWITGELFAVLNNKNLEISQSPISAKNLAKLINLIKNGTISGKIAKTIFELMMDGDIDPQIIVEEKGLKQESDPKALEAIIDKIINDNREKAIEYKNGKEKLFGFSVGQAMKASSGKVLFYDEDVTDVPSYELFSKGILRTFQIAHEFTNLSVLENLMMVPPNQSGEKLMTALLKPSLVRTEELAVKQKAQDVVDFLNLTHLSNELAGNLSGGQKKLLELGRTMMVDAKLVLLDEVGAGVNRTLLKDLGTAILKLNKEEGYTFCMIEHDMEFISRLCNPVIVMAEGSVLFEGTAEEAKKDEKVIESYLGRGSKIKDEN